MVNLSSLTGLTMVEMALVGAAVVLTTILYYYLRLTHGRRTPPRYVTTAANLRGGIRATAQRYGRAVGGAIALGVATVQLVAWSVKGALVIDPVVIGNIGFVATILAFVSGSLSAKLAVVAAAVVFVFFITNLDRLDPR